MKEQRRAAPDAGLGFGLLRHLHPQAGPVLAAAARPQVLRQLPRPGRRDRRCGAGRLVPGRPRPTPSTAAPDAGAPLGYLLQIDAAAEPDADGRRTSLARRDPRPGAGGRDRRPRRRLRRGAGRPRRLGDPARRRRADPVRPADRRPRPGRDRRRSRRRPRAASTTSGRSPRCRRACCSCRRSPTTGPTSTRCSSSSSSTATSTAPGSRRRSPACSPATPTCGSGSGPTPAADRCRSSPARSPMACAEVDLRGRTGRRAGRRRWRAVAARRPGHPLRPGPPAAAAGHARAHRRAATAWS